MKAAVLLLAIAVSVSSAGLGLGEESVLVGQAVFGDWRKDHPGVRRHLTAADLPRPFATRPVAAVPQGVAPPTGARPQVPDGFSVTRFATELDGPRLLRVAPNGDVFVAETSAGNIRVLRASDGAPTAASLRVFATGLDGPFGVAFFPPGPDPRWLYVANNNSVVRFPYRSGDLAARGAPETIVAAIADTTEGHTTRDVLFSADGRQMYVSVGSATNIGEDMPRKSPADLRAWQTAHASGAGWGGETDRADVLVFDPDGGGRRVFATGIRNCVGMALQGTAVWCATNERDLLGDDLVPDYVTRLRSGAFYGWPWFYIGANEDPRHKGERPDLSAATVVPDVLLQPHSAPLQMTFYDPPTAAPAVFPSDFAGDAFVALHGSWNRAKRTGYKVVRIRLKNGAPTGEYDDFMTGFVLDDDRVWGRPVGVAVAHDGALLVSEDQNGTIWRVAPDRQP